MSIISSIVLIFIFAIPAVFAIQPLLGNRLEKPSEAESQINLLQRRKQVLYRQIKELELEHGLGLVTDSEFESLRGGIKQQVSLILSELKKRP